MSKLHLVTGYAGEAHITAEDHGSFNAALTNGGNYVLQRGNRLSASIINNTTVRVLDGDMLIQGRHVRLPDSAYADLLIEAGTQGKVRNDLIVARYTRNTVTGVEECSFVVIKGTSVASDPVDPAHTSGDLLVNHDAQSDFPLYRVRLDGVQLKSVEQLFEVITFVTVGADGKINNSFLPAMNFVPLTQKGKASGVATLDGDGKVPTGQIPSLDYIPTSKRGSASGVASLDANGKVPSSQIPELSYVPTSKVGVASGVVPLNASKKIEETYLPAFVGKTVLNASARADGYVVNSFVAHRMGDVVFVCGSITKNKSSAGSTLTISGLPSGSRTLAFHVFTESKDSSQTAETVKVFRINAARTEITCDTAINAVHCFEFFYIAT